MLNLKLPWTKRREARLAAEAAEQQDRDQRRQHDLELARAHLARREAERTRRLLASVRLRRELED